jgi:WD40 repeat protein
MEMYASLRSLVLLSVASLGLLTISAGPEESKDHSQTKRPVTIVDSIGMNLIADDSYYAGYSLVGPVAKFSPDGRNFVVVLRKGNLKTNTNDYSLLLWRTNTVYESPAPERLLIMSSSSNRQAIDQILWLDDNETLVFLGEHPGENRQLYTFNIRTRVLRKLTNHPTNVLNYDMTRDGTTIAYTADEPLVSIFNTTASRVGFPVSTEWLQDLLEGTKGGAERGNPQLFLQSSGNAPRLMKISDGLLWGAPYLSPNGKYIVIRTNVAEVPASWRGYSDSELSWLLQARAAPGRYSWLSRYAFIDATTGQQRVLLDAPISRRSTSNIAWLSDSHSVAIQGVYLPLDNTEGKEREARRTTVFSVEVKIPSGDLITISQEDLTLLKWDSRLNRLVFEAGTGGMKPESGPKVYFQRVGEGWEKSSERVMEESRPVITLDEDVNVPPSIVVTTPETGQKKLLLDLNPQFKELEFSRVQEIHWTDPDGHDVSGGLYYPIGYIAGNRYPLVIQTHGWNSHRFWIDGAYTSGYAAQALAAKGIMVLQADENYAGQNTFASVKREVGTLERAIEYLDAESLVDRERVGVIGFSITGIYVKYAMTHSRYRFAAAAVADDNDAGYFQYIMNGNYSGPLQEMYESINGGLPFGKSLESWMARTPAFNAARVQTPLRIVVHRPASLLWEWEWFAALRLLDKPVDMIYMQDGEHILVKPWERMISQQGNVDWFAFWLEGEQDPDPAKAQQYARWHELRDLQKANQANESTGHRAN